MKKTPGTTDCREELDKPGGRLEQWKREPLEQESWEPINGRLWIASILISWIVIGLIIYGLSWVVS